VKSKKPQRSLLNQIDKLERFSRQSLYSMQKRSSSSSSLDPMHLMRRAEDLVNAAPNRYRITVQVANRAKRRRYEDFDSWDEPILKPVMRAIIEMSDELTQPEIIGE